MLFSLQSCLKHNNKFPPHFRKDAMAIKNLEVHPNEIPEFLLVLLRQVELRRQPEELAELVATGVVLVVLVALLSMDITINNGCSGASGDRGSSCFVAILVVEGVKEGPRGDEGQEEEEEEAEENGGDCPEFHLSQHARRKSFRRPPEKEQEGLQALQEDQESPAARGATAAAFSTDIHHPS